MDIKELLEMVKESEEVKEDFNPEETKKPTEEDLDDIFDAINTLNKAEWFCERQDQVDTLVKAQNILKYIKDCAEGVYDDIEEE